ncbi:MAG: hypothetical protein WCO71_12345 [Pseudomonadota bacterium]
MDCHLARNKNLLIRAIELMQRLLSPGEFPRFSSDSFPEYAFSEFTHDLKTCGKDEETFLAGNAQALSEITIRRKMPTLWLVKMRHPVFAVYGALCKSINRPINNAALFLGENDFPKMTKYGTKLIRSPLRIIGMEDGTSLSAALEKLPARKQPWTVLCNWRFDACDTSAAEAFAKDGTACIIRPE